MDKIRNEESDWEREKELGHSVFPVVISVRI